MLTPMIMACKKDECNVNMDSHRKTGGGRGKATDQEGSTSFSHAVAGRGRWPRRE